MERRRITLENIHIGNRHRAPNIDKVREIAKSISEIGLLNPPAVVFRDGIVIDGEETENTPVLIYGRHRVLALLELGEVSAECIVHDVDDDYATIMEADENLARSEIQGAERTLSVRLREAAWNRIRAKMSIVQNLDDTKKTSKRGRINEGRPTEFATETAQASGMSRSAIYQELKRAEEIGEDNLKKIVGTPLGKGVEMDALIRLPEPERVALIERAAAGEKVSARPQPEPKSLTADKALDLMAADIIAAHSPATLSSPIAVISGAAEADALSGTRAALDEFLGRFAGLTVDQRRECLAGRDLSEVFDAYTN